MLRTKTSVLGLILIYFSIPSYIYGQIKIVDSLTNDPVAFASVVSLKNPEYSGLSDENGLFIYNEKSLNTKFKISYVGYHDKTFVLKKGLTTVKLTEYQSLLKEITIKPNDDPAISLVKKVVKNLDKFNLDNYNYYQCKEYSKTSFGFVEKSDSVQFNLIFNKKLPKSLFISEAVIEKQFESKDKKFNKIIATQMSGIRNAQFAVQSEDMIPFHIFKNRILIYNKEYVHPISELSWTKYRFNIDTCFTTNEDSFCILKFWPKSERFNCFKGNITISCSKYAVVNIDIYSTEFDLYPFSFGQKFTWSEGKIFPQSTYTNFYFPSILDNKLQIEINQKSYFDDISFRPIIIPLSKRNTSVIESKSEEANKSIIYANRKFTLLKSDSTAYEFGDYFMKKTQAGIIVNNLEYLINKQYPIFFVNLDLTSIYKVNWYEGSRFGLGLRTNRLLFEDFDIGGYIGHGQQDKAYKYGASFNYYFNQDRSHLITYEYKHDLISNNTFRYKNGFLNNFYAHYWNKLERHAFLAKNVIGNIKTTFNFSNDKIEPLYAYKYSKKPPDDKSIFNFSEVGLTFDYFKARKLNFFNTYFFVRDFYSPSIKLSIQQGISGIFGSNYTYSLFDFQASNVFVYPVLGRTKITIEGGYTIGDVPLYKIFSSPGSGNSGPSAIISNSFQTMPPSEYWSNKFAHLFIEHEFGKIYGHKYSRPEFSISFNAGYGKLNNPSLHQLVEIKDYEHGYYEIGAGLRNIIRIPIKDWFAIGFNFGAYTQIINDQPIYKNKDFTYKFGFNFAY